MHLYVPQPQIKAYASMRGFTFVARLFRSASRLFDLIKPIALSMDALFMLFCLLLAGNAMANDDKTIFGYIEKATLVDKDLTLSAKLDTGAKSASLNATKITELMVNGKPYLAFIVPSKEGDIAFQCEYIGQVNIKVRSGETQVHALLRRTIQRPVVLMNIRLDGKERKIRVNLTNRKRFIYPLLLGREAINAFNGVIDPSQKYTLKMKKAAG